MIYLLLIESESDKIKFTQIYEQYRYTMLYTAMRILKDQGLAAIPSEDELARQNSFSP